MSKRAFVLRIERHVMNKDCVMPISPYHTYLKRSEKKVYFGNLYDYYVEQVNSNLMGFYIFCRKKN